MSKERHKSVSYMASMVDTSDNNAKGDCIISDRHSETKTYLELLEQGQLILIKIGFQMPEIVLGQYIFFCCTVRELVCPLPLNS